MSSLTQPLRFDAEQHRYFAGTRELPSVTTVLREAGLIDTTFYTEDARDRGTTVHLAIQALDEGHGTHVDPEIAPYVAAYQRFCELTRPVWSHIEHRIADEALGYAGTLDRAGALAGAKTVVDVKTGTVPPWVGLQTAAYRRCLPEPHTWRRAALQLKADGSFSLHDLTDRRDEAVFLAALTLVQWKKGARR